jgi:hypothetical protein
LGTKKATLWRKREAISGSIHQIWGSQVPMLRRFH